MTVTLAPLISPRSIAAAAAALACLFASLLLAPAAGAAWPGRNGAIAFAQERADAGGSDIRIFYSAYGEGGLTATSRVEETDPTFSPNGHLIAYVRRKPGGQGDIWVMDENGNNRRAVVESGRTELQPSFFPSGRALVFSIYDGGSGWDVYSVRLDGSGLRLLVREGSDPVVSPDGRYLAYSRNGHGGGIRLRNLRSGRERQLTTGSTQGLEFSPDGKQLLFVGARHCSPRSRDLGFQLLKIGLGGRRPTFLRRSCKIEFAGAGWSPNGRRIVYVRHIREGRRFKFRLAMMTASGGAVAWAAPHRPGSNELFPTWQPLH
jgi:Tol biopolymer transport system component